MQVALPGFEGKDIEVTATPIEVIVPAATKKEKSTQDVNVLWTEFGSNDVYRRFEVANPIDVDRVTAMLENGILRINAPETAKPMEVNAAINPVLGAGFFGVNEQEPFRNACSVDVQSGNTPKGSDRCNIAREGTPVPSEATRRTSYPPRPGLMGQGGAQLSTLGTDCRQ